MRKFDPEAMADAVVLTVKAATAPLDARLVGVEQRLASIRDGRDGVAGRDGKDADPVDVDAVARKAAALVPAPDLDAVASKVASLIPAPKDGTDGKDAQPVDLDAIALKAAELIPVPKDGKDGAAPDLEAVAKVAALLIPVPKDGQNGQDGKDVDPALVEGLKAEIVALREELAASELRSKDFLVEMRAWLSAEVSKSVAEIPVPKDGTSVDPADVEAMVTKAVAALPLPKDGQSVTVEDVAPLIAGEVEKAVKALPVPKDGVGVAGALIDKDGLLVLTLSDGRMKELGLVVGRDGERGEAGVSGGPGADGINGKDGTIENLIPDYDADTRTLSFFYKDDMRPVEGWVLKMLGSTIYRGIYDPTRTYEIGEQVTYGGSQWTAKADSQGKQPGTNEGASFWQLSVKRGNDGKPGIQGAKGLDGKPGAPGRDGTRSY